MGNSGHTAEGPMKGILACCDEPLVSRDFNGDPHSSTVDMENTYVVGGNMIKVLWPGMIMNGVSRIGC